MKTILETERLRLREFNPGDCKFIIRLFNSPGWLKFIGDRKVKTIEQALYYLETGPMKSYKEHGYGLYLVEKRDDATPVGMCGLLNRKTLEHPDIGFAFLPPFSGQGYALEIAKATLAYASDKLGITKIAAITLPENLKSIRLLEKIGLRYHKRFSFPNSTEELLLFVTDDDP